MGVIPYTEEFITADTIRVKWTPLQNGDTGVPYGIAGAYPNKTVEITGTLGPGGEVTIQGCNAMPGSVAPTFFTLNSAPAGVPMVMTGLMMQKVMENPTQFRPNITNGDGTTLLTVRVTMSRLPS